MKMLIDASVALSWFVVCEETEASLALLERRRLRAPDILAAEVRGALRTLSARGELPQRQLSGMERRLSQLAIEMSPSDPHLREAFRLAQIISEPIYSCIYLALAQALDMPVVTADRRFYAAARRSPATAGHVRFISEAA